MFKFSKRSEGFLKEVHIDLQKICQGVKEISEIDFDISCGYRSPEDQMKAFKAGKSQLDGVSHLSNHNKEPAMAVDIYCYKGKFADYDVKKMGYMAGLFHAVSENLFNRGIIKHQLSWGGWWTDLVDTPHFELK
jgi:hypothetical protein